MQTTANYGLKKPEGNDTVDIDVINGNMDTIDTELEKRMLSNEFSVSGTPLTTEKSNIIGMVNELFTSADNGKTSIYNAIVGKGTTPASNSFTDLTSGINSIARGQGNAVESQVRAGVKFSNADGTLRTGTLPVQATAAQTITPGASNIIKNAGIYDGAITISGDTNLASANIKSGATIFGVSGKSSVVDTADATASSSQISNGQTAYVNGNKITGSNNYMVGATISDNNLSTVHFGSDEVWSSSDVPYANGIAVDASGNVYVAYYNNPGKITVRKFNSSGQVIWSLSDCPEASAIAVDASGNVYVAYENDSGNTTVRKLNISGQEIWSLSDVSKAYGIAVDASGNVYVAYCNYNPGIKTVRKLNSSGQEIWWLADVIEASAIAVDASGNVYVTYLNGQGNTTVRKLNSSGVQIWSLFDVQTATGIAVDASGNVYVSYCNTSGNKTVRKLNISGQEIWSSSDCSEARGIAVDASGNVYVAYNVAAGSVSVRKLNSSGHEVWSSSDASDAVGIAVDASGNVYVSYCDSLGYKTVRKFYGQNIYTIKS